MKAVIFDLDGGIVFTDKYHYLAWKKIADELGIEFNEKINNRLRGVSRLQSLDIVLEKYDIELSEDEKYLLAENKNGFYRMLLSEMNSSDLSDEVRDTLDNLRTRGYKLAIGSSSKNTPLILSKIGLGDYFDAVSDGNNITRSKPDPEVFLKAAEYLGMAAADCYVVEDALAGIDAAKAAGMQAIAIGDATNSGNADCKLQRISELLDILS